MDSRLFLMWRELNHNLFENELEPVTDISYFPLTREEGIDAFGVYFQGHNAIVLDERFRPDPALHRAGDPVEEAKGEVVTRLLIHEMIHQAQHQRGLERAGGHGVSFIAVAGPIAEKLGVATPTEATAGRWPELAHLLVQFGL